MSETMAKLGAVYAIPSVLLRCLALEGPIASDVEALLLEALTHRTWVNEQSTRGWKDNQRLELLGDAVLELIVTDQLYARLPEADEGLLSRARAVLVNEGALAAAARRLELGSHLRLGRGEAASGGRERDGTLADALEAAVAAVYLIGGLPCAKELVLEALGAELPRVCAEASREHAPSSIDARAKDAKSVLQECLQKDGSPPPTYAHEERPQEQEARFIATVSWKGTPLATATGRSRREAERRAAERALEGYDFRDAGHGVLPSRATASAPPAPSGPERASKGPEED